MPVMSNAAVAIVRPPEIYGTHLMLRLGGIARFEALDDPDLIQAYLGDLVTGIGMRILAGPYTKTEDADSARYGHSGIVLLYESHAAVHTYPNLRSVFLDVFSCKPFEVSAVLAITEDSFGRFDIVESAVLDRGHHWAVDAETELQRWLEAR